MSNLHIFKDEGVKTDSLKVELKDNDLESLNRDNIEVSVIHFPKNFTFKVPGRIGEYTKSDPLSLFRIQGDPFLLESVFKLKAECAVSGSSAASSKESLETVIGRINREFKLPTNESLYRDQINPIDKNIKGIEYQSNAIYFNDGSGIVLGDLVDKEYVYQVLDFPNDELKKNTKYSKYLELKRTLIGTTIEKENVSFSGNMKEIEEFCISKRIKIGILSSPSFIQNNRVLTEEEIFSKCMLGDPRHFIREPYKNGVIHMEVIAEAIREGRGREIYESLKNKTPIVFDIPPHLRNTLNENNLEFIRSAYMEDLLYGKDFSKEVNIKENKLYLPCLVRGVYNHVLTGINSSGEIVLVIIPGVLEDGRTGQSGLSLEEITNLSETLVNKYDLVSLIDSCQGRDIGAMTIIDSTPKLVSQNTELSVSLLGNYIGKDKPTNTSPRVMLIKKS